MNKIQIFDDFIEIIKWNKIKELSNILSNNDAIILASSNGHYDILKLLLSDNRVLNEKFTIGS